MKRIIYIIFSVLFFATNALAQYNITQNRVWAMSTYAGLNFNGGLNPQIIHTAAFPYTLGTEGCASVADNEGDLMFYTNGVTIWNANGGKMPHGDSLSGSNFYAYNVTQNSVIVPFVNDGSRYYLFVMTKNAMLNYYVKCFIVNMNLNNHRGDIEKSHPLNGIMVDSLISTEKMISVSGCNNDVWLLTRSSLGSTTASFHSFHITDNGINLSPTISDMPNVSYGIIGVLKVNEQRTKLVECSNSLMLYNFNPNNGSVSQPQLVEQHFYYGAAWSQDGSKLYVSGAYQFDVTDSNMLATKTFVGKQGGQFSDLKLAPDGKIYFKSRTPADPSKYMACINNPNNPAASCGYQDSVIHFTDSMKLISYGLPNEVWLAHTPPAPIGHVIKDTLICKYEAVSLQAKPGQLTYLWDDGTTDTARLITESGRYWVKYTDPSCNVYVDTYKVRGIPLDTLQVLRSYNLVFTTNAYDGYQWYKNGHILEGAVYHQLAIDGDGVYTVMVRNATGCSDTSSIVVSGTTPIYDPKFVSESIKVYPNPATDVVNIQSPIAVRVAVYTMDGRCVNPANTTKTIDLSGKAKGVYFLKITDKDDLLIKMQKIIKE